MGTWSKHLGWCLPKRWRALLVVALVAAVSLLLAPATPVRADDPCQDPQVRAAMRQAQQAYAQLLQAYASMPPEVRAQADAAVRQATGYTIPQLQQLILRCGDSGRGPQPTTPPRTQPTAPTGPC